MVAANLPAADENWESASAEWLGRASMSKRHRFLTTRDLSWSWFNALVFGLESTERLQQAISTVEQMLAAAKLYTEHHGWSGNVGFFFHIYGHSSVNSLHMHMLDLDFAGPTFRHLAYKNLPAADVLDVLREDLRNAASDRLHTRFCADICAIQ